MPAPTEPTFTRHADGSITAEWPDPIRPSYEVAHEVLVQWLADQNELNEWRLGIRKLPVPIESP